MQINRTLAEFFRWTNATTHERRELKIYLAFMRLRKAIEGVIDEDEEKGSEKEDPEDRGGAFSTTGYV